MSKRPVAQDRGCLSEQAPDTVSGGGTPGTSSAAQGQRETPLCESKNCPNRAIGLLEDRHGVRWAVCEQHATLDEWGYPKRTLEDRASEPGHP